MPITLSSSDLEELLAFSIDLASKAGGVILEGSKVIRRELGSATAVDSKKNSTDLVTEWDVKVENLVRQEIEKKYPTFGLYVFLVFSRTHVHIHWADAIHSIGEESYSKGDRPELTDDPTFCVDPIDGTTNFVHGFPFSCISIGVIYQKKPVIGVIFNPFLSQLVSPNFHHAHHTLESSL